MKIINNIKDSFKKVEPQKDPPQKEIEMTYFERGLIKSFKVDNKYWSFTMPRSYGMDLMRYTLTNEKLGVIINFRSFINSDNKISALDMSFINNGKELDISSIRNASIILNAALDVDLLPRHSAEIKMVKEEIAKRESAKNYLESLGCSLNDK